MEPAGIYEAVFDAFIQEILLKLCEGSTVAGVSLERNWGRARSWHFENKTWAYSRLGSSSDGNLNIFLIEMNLKVHLRSWDVCKLLSFVLPQLLPEGQYIPYLVGGPQDMGVLE